MKRPPRSSPAGCPPRASQRAPWASRQVASGYPHGFQRDTWAVFAPSSRAGDARALLRQRGDEACIASARDDLSREQRATLRLVLILAVYAGLPAIILGAVYAILD